jgi:hypothetical protein
MRHERPHVREETGKRRISTASLYWALQTPFESRKVQNIAVRAPLNRLLKNPLTAPESL